MFQGEDEGLSQLAREGKLLVKCRCRNRAALFMHASVGKSNND